MNDPANVLFERLMAVLNGWCVENPTLSFNYNLAAIERLRIEATARILGQSGFMVIREPNRELKSGETDSPHDG